MKTVENIILAFIGSIFLSLLINAATLLAMFPVDFFLDSVLSDTFLWDIAAQIGMHTFAFSLVYVPIHCFIVLLNCLQNNDGSLAVRLIARKNHLYGLFGINGFLWCFFIMSGLHKIIGR